MTLLNTSNEITLNTTAFNTLRLRQNGRHFADNIFKGIFFNENIWLSHEIWLKCILKGLGDNKSTLVQAMTWSKTGNMSVSAAMKTKFYDTAELSWDYLKIPLVNFLNTMFTDDQGGRLNKKDGLTR